jgi:hypothetical protein
MKKLLFLLLFAIKVVFAKQTHHLQGESEK